MRVDDLLDLETLRGRQIKIRLHVPERIEDDRMPLAGDDITQASPRRATHLVDGQVVRFHDWARRVVVSPLLHPACKVGTRVAELAKGLRYELRRTSLGADGQNRNILRKLAV